MLDKGAALSYAAAAGARGSQTRALALPLPPIGKGAAVQRPNALGACRATTHAIGASAPPAPPREAYANPPARAVPKALARALGVASPPSEGGLGGWLKPFAQTKRSPTRPPGRCPRRPREPLALPAPLAKGGWGVETLNPKRA